MQQILEKISVSIARMIMPVATYRGIKGTESQQTILFVKQKIIIAEAKGMENFRIYLSGSPNFLNTVSMVPSIFAIPYVTLVNYISETNKEGKACHDNLY